MASLQLLDQLKTGQRGEPSTASEADISDHFRRAGWGRYLRSKRDGLCAE
jgi:hypothetical protein